MGDYIEAGVLVALVRVYVAGAFQQSVACLPGQLES